MTQQFVAKGVSIVHLSCVHGHKQDIFLEGLGLDWARGMAGLLDGSSGMFVHDPRVDRKSNIGRCGTCRAQITAVVEESLGRTHLTHLMPRADCTCLCHVFTRVVLHTVPCCDEPNDHLSEVLATPPESDQLVQDHEGRTKAYVRPLRSEYRHVICNTVTAMNMHIAQAFARDPGYQKETYCIHCGTTAPVGEYGEFVWVDDDSKVGT